MSSYLYEDIDEDIYSFYMESFKGSDGDVTLAIAEASLFFMEDETFIEDAIRRYINGEENEDA